MDPYGNRRQQNGSQQPYMQQPNQQQFQGQAGYKPVQSFQQFPQDQQQHHQQQFVPQSQHQFYPHSQQQQQSSYVPQQQHTSYPPFMQQSTTPSATSPQSFHSQFSSTTGHRTEQLSGQLDNSNTSGYYFPEISWKEAFGSGGLPGDAPLLQELGINLAHIGSKSIAVLNPIKSVDKHLMDDTDLAGPLLFCIFFPIFLLFSGKVHFDAIYGIALIGIFGAFLLLNVMSEVTISIAQAASVLGYCMLPMVMLAFSSMFVKLRNPLGCICAIGCVLWCTGVASKMFVSVLSMRNQFFLVAYPIFLFYAAFALMTIF